MIDYWLRRALGNGIGLRFTIAMQGMRDVVHRDAYRLLHIHHQIRPERRNVWDGLKPILQSRTTLTLPISGNGA